MSGIGGHTVWPPGLKFGMEDHIHPWKVNAYVCASCPPPTGWGRPKSASGGPCSQNAIAAGLDFTLQGGLEFTAGAENAPGEAEYPC